MTFTRETRIAPDFALGEFICLQDPLPDKAVFENLVALAQRLQVIRDIFDAPLTITSGYRSAVYNQKIGGAPESFHLRGMAADIVIAGIPPRRLQAFLKNWSGGLGCYDTFTHLDTGPKRRW